MQRTRNRAADFATFSGKNMMEKVACRLMKAGEEAKVFDLVERTFHEFVAPDFSPQGVETFFRSVNLPAMTKRPQENHIIMVALLGDTLVGMLDIRDNNHICLFFVDKEHHMRGIGKQLLDAAIVHCLACDPSVEETEVHASPFSVPIYARLGFETDGEEQESHGIRYTRMVKKLKPKSG